MTIGVGKTLDNGALVLAYKEAGDRRVVCADFGSDRITRFATWRVDAENNCFWGHYFPTSEEAFNDFHQR